MYAIVDIVGQQFKVEKDQKLFVNRMAGETGTEVKFDKVLLVDNDGAVTVGKPQVENASVTAKILRHVRGDKVIVFKKKRRTGYKKKNGHRQNYTEIQISEIVAYILTVANHGTQKRSGSSRKAGKSHSNAWVLNFLGGRLLRLVILLYASVEQSTIPVKTLGWDAIIPYMPL